MVLSHPATVKALSPGRIIEVNNSRFRRSLAVILQTGPSSSKERTFTCLVICEQRTTAGDLASNSQSKTAESSQRQDGRTEETESQASDWLSPQPYIASELFRPEGPCGHEMVVLKCEDIAVVTTKTIKIIPDRIIDDIRKRKQPRFR